MTAVTEAEAKDAALTIHPLQPTIGVEISGADLRDPITDAERDQIKAAILHPGPVQLAPRLDRVLGQPRRGALRRP
jgi:hypothetical protein